jgi:NAD(P)H dehydrogenase (quinone)
MRFLVVYAHPVKDSFQSAIHRCVISTLRDVGHDVDDCDLYAEGFQPVMSANERQVYHDITANRTDRLTNYTQRLVDADGIVFVFPTWWYGMPAILKGYFDRVWLPGVALAQQTAVWRPK